MTKTELQTALAACEAEIEEFEKKRLRSMATIFGAQLEGQEPSESDVQYFKVYSDLINLKRKELRRYRDELSLLPEQK